MVNNEYLLSICIPTYNRSKELDNTLKSIIDAIGENNHTVEIVVSDNNSTDGTNNIIKRYRKNNKNIKYYKNDKNVKDRNFPLALSRANGKYLKLSNDSFCYNKESLNYMINIIRENFDEQNQLVFFNNSIQYQKKLDLNSFMKLISYNITDIQNFGIWKNDFTYDEIGCNQSLYQIYKFMDVNKRKKETVLISNNYGYRQYNKTKDLSYGLYNVFYINYLSIFKDSLLENRISNDCYYYLKKDIILNFFAYWIANAKINSDNYVLSKNENIESLIDEECKKEKYNYIYLLKKYYFVFKKYFKKIYDKYK